jgi:hypothetical protein
MRFPLKQLFKSDNSVTVLDLLNFSGEESENSISRMNYK